MVASCRLANRDRFTVQTETALITAVPWETVMMTPTTTCLQ